MSEYAGLKFMLVEHESHCPGAQGDPSNCCCEPTMRMVGASEFTASMSKTRTKSRAARRATERALAKAKRKGGQQ